MKKCDLYIVAMYAIFLLLTIVAINKASNDFRDNKLQIAENITNHQSIKALVIQNTEAHIDLYTLDSQELQDKNWQIRGRIHEDDLECISIVDDTLHINGISSSWRLGIIKLCDTIPVEIINAPNTQWLSKEDYEERVNNSDGKYDI